MIRTTLLALGASLVAQAALAAAAPIKLEESTTLKAPPAQIWAIIHDFGDMSWIPPVKSVTATDGNTPGSVRTIDLGGPKLTETLKGYDAHAMTYDYVIDDSAANKATMPVSDYHSWIKVTPGADGGSVVTWRGEFLRVDHSDTPKAGQDDETAKNAIHGVYQAGFSGLHQQTGG